MLFENKPLKVMVEFSLEQPKGGVHFVTPPCTTTADSQAREVQLDAVFICMCMHVFFSFGSTSMLSVMAGKTLHGVCVCDTVAASTYCICCVHMCRLWFPCVDSFTEPCRWTLYFTVPAHMMAISCGDLMEQARGPQNMHTARI